MQDEGLNLEAYASGGSVPAAWAALDEDSLTHNFGSCNKNTLVIGSQSILHVPHNDMRHGHVMPAAHSI